MTPALTLFKISPLYPQRHSTVRAASALVICMALCVALLSSATHAAATENFVGWGYDNFGQATTLGACAKISSGGQHTLALQSDGTVVAWGAGKINTGTWPELGQAMVPATLGTCTQISAGYAHCMAI